MGVLKYLFNGNFGVEKLTKGIWNCSTITIIIITLYCISDNKVSMNCTVWSSVSQECVF